MQTRGLKVTVIGGGSSYTPELVEGLIRAYPVMPVRELWLVDIEAGRFKLETVGALARRMIDRAGVAIAVHLAFDRQAAIQGADFVLTQLRVGLLDARARDERIPLRYHRIGQETTGAGGFAKALRTIPVIVDICRDIEALAPGATLINFTNPAGIVTEAVLKHSSVRAIGLCNLPIGTRMQIAKWQQVDVSQVEIEVVGLNHLHWVTKAWVDGLDVLPQLLAEMAAVERMQHDQRVVAQAADRGVGADTGRPQNIPDIEFNPEFLQTLGALPCAYHRYYYMPDVMLAEELEAAANGGTRAEVVKKIEAELFELYRDPNLDIKPPQLAQRGGAFYSEAAVNLMTSIVTDRGDIQTVNVRNGSTLPFLPADAAIEVNCVIDAKGARPVDITAPVSPHMRGLLQVVKAYEELTVEAAVRGDRAAAWQALTVHPLVQSSDVAQRLLTDILNENREFLPQFQ
ncbi:6-phospho-beta-glucosidase [Alicyclobacillus sp. ALC3]|uniref:6-phospho-beta-glucosidase n=1 Tax=Alicyclobacillus sp. ALC3 TaxID=2796143 RepID=UPI0023787BB4|nr:6-phospho-beta-glucosidase [Alicyclobacillus sp. ALC3]WDL98721.1 6-phospho-beta-glucosidase [Alicyclobacillus sp. ALC3]